MYPDKLRDSYSFYIISKDGTKQKVGKLENVELDIKSVNYGEPTKDDNGNFTMEQTIDVKLPIKEQIRIKLYCLWLKLRYFNNKTLQVEIETPMDRIIEDEDMDIWQDVLNDVKEEQ